MLRDWSDRAPAKRRPFLFSLEFFAGALSAFILIAIAAGLYQMINGCNGLGSN